ncbi:MAG: translation initiation factor Sui1 [Saccharospirillaceae bacterium]|nr:translation initiation factor Sui1 [Saccharospirillaceae bacterium]
MAKDNKPVDLSALLAGGLGSAKTESNNSGSVYSTEVGRTCPGCGNAKNTCTCSDETSPQGDGIVRVSRESKGRGGKVVTLVAGVPLTGAELKTLAKELKKKCGVGGALKDGVIEIQGEHRDLLVSELIRRGFTVKKSGG